MAKIQVDKQLYFDGISGEAKIGYRHPLTHVIVFDDADEVDVPEPVTVEVAEPERAEIEVEDTRFEALPEEDSEE